MERAWAEAKGQSREGGKKKKSEKKIECRSSRCQKTGRIPNARSKPQERRLLSPLNPKEKKWKRKVGGVHVHSGKGFALMGEEERERMADRLTKKKKNKGGNCRRREKLGRVRWGDGTYRLCCVITEPFLGSSERRKNRKAGPLTRSFPPEKRLNWRKSFGRRKKKESLMRKRTLALCRAPGVKKSHSQKTD